LSPAVAGICRHLPQTRCGFIAIKPSPTPYRRIATMDYPVR
jgi:hypothetical protein